MIRTLDGTFLTEIANHPDVRPWLGADGALDLRPIISDPANISLQGSCGGFVLQALDAGRYEAHSIFLPAAREAPGLAHEGFRYLFTETDCLEVVTKVPDGNVRAHGLARWCGFAEQFRRDTGWEGLGCSYRALSFDAWKARDKTLVGHGAWFHALIETAKRESGSQLPIHSDDEAHDRAVGASVLMIQAGNARKAVWTYNRWARFAGYTAIKLISENPILVDVGDAIVDAASVILTR